MTTSTSSLLNKPGDDIVKMSDIKGFFITLVVFILIDMIWIGSISSTYSKMMETIQGTPIKMKYLGAILAYLFVQHLDIVSQLLDLNTYL